MSAIAVGVVVEVTREAVHRGIDWEAIGVVLLPILSVSLGEGIFAKGNIMVGR